MVEWLDTLVHKPGYGVSSRDGAAAFLYFIELYLRRA
jgi:hypothetical protein